MTNFITAALLLLAALAPAPPQEPAPAQKWDVPVGPNLVRNGSFEESADGGPAGWYAPAAVYGPDQSLSRTGRQSLKFVNDDPGRYLLCTQPVEIVPGGMYELEGWVKTADVRGPDSGATLCLEWQDAEGKYLGGYYPEGRKGDTPEWTRVVGSRIRVPAEAASAHVTCYVRRGMTGTAWWDDVSFRRMRQRPLLSFLVSPSYRGWILDGGPDHVQIRLRFVWDDVPGGPGSVSVVGRLARADGDADIAEQSPDSLASGEAWLRLPLPDLAPGDYRLTIEMLDRATGAAICGDVHRLQRRAGPVAGCFVDAHNRLIVDGEPFFPLGMYWSGAEEEQLRTYAQGPFNCLMPYGLMTPEQMDLIHSLGLKVICSVKDFYYGTQWCPDSIKSEADEEPAVRSRVRQFRDHPALIAWYMNDEQPLSMLPRLKEHQRWIEEEDPRHPTWTVLFQVDDVASYAGSFDVMGTDPYPIPERPPSLAGEWARMTRAAVDDARALWMVPQAFNKAVYAGLDEPGRQGRAPTLDEMRSMTWQCIAEGADGIVFYSWFDLRRDPAHPFEERWPEVKQVAQEVADMAPVLLSIEPVPELQVSGPASLHWAARRYEGTVYLFAVNDGTDPVEATVSPAGPPQAVSLAGRSVPVSEEGTFEVQLPPLGVNVYRIRM